MRIYTNIEDTPALRRPVVTVGTFDGLHIGHREIIRRMKGIAGSIGGEPLVVTFHPHPRLVLYADSEQLRFLSSREQKYRLLAGFGIGHLLEIPFTREFAAATSESFIRDTLVGKLKAHTVIIGYDHHFGKNREGNLEELRKFSLKYGFSVEEVPAQYMDGVAVSSTQIRNALMAGETGRANRMLGYDYPISGTVVKGKGIGKQLGFPTANIVPVEPTLLLPCNGVYACIAEYGNDRYRAMGNIGMKPTIGENTFTFEVHLLGFTGDLYGRTLTIHFLERIREERVFPNLEALKQQLETDRQVVEGVFEARKLLTGSSKR